MFTLRRPSDSTIAVYRRDRLGLTPAHPSTSGQPAGFRKRRFSYEIGHGEGAFARACAGLRQWVPHRGAGIEVVPPNVDLVVGETVTILTRRLGLWILAASRIEAVTDDETAFGFTYATLPDHPETGFETFMVHLAADQVRFDIDVVSKPDALLARLGTPVSRAIQQRITDAYGSSLRQHVGGEPTTGP